MKQRSRLVYVLWASIAVMIVCLAGLVAFVHTAGVRIEETNRLIADDTAPSLLAIQSSDIHLSRLRSMLRERLQGVDPDPAQRSAVDMEQALLDKSMEWYFSLPVDPGEEEVMVDLRRHLGEIRDVTAEILALHPSAPPRVREQLRAEVDVRTAGLDEELLRASHINADLSFQAVRRLQQVGRILLPGALAMELMSLLAAVVAIGTTHRLSQREAAVAERRVLQKKNAELEAFSARVAHDLLSPLMTVSMALGLAEQKLASREDERVRGMLCRASRSLQRVRQMVSDLLDFARAAAAPPSGVSTEVAPLIQDLVADLQPLAAEAGVDLQAESATGLRVPCAAGILSSMLSNLVQNAVRHVRGADERKVVVRAREDGPEVRLEVEDTGPGVRPEDREVIFEPYVSRSEEGSGLGLGLATVKRLAESHGGHVGVDGGHSHGALFWVALPTAA